MIITISRQAATNGGLLAQYVAEKLRLRMYHREVVDEIARRLDLDIAHVIPFDDTMPTPVDALLREWRHSINHLVYLRHLRFVLEKIASHGDAVIVGRGANFILKDTATLRVRVIAPLKDRISMYQAGKGVSEAEARAWIIGEDARRSAFTRELFHHRVDNPQHYDLCINYENLTIPQAAKVIVKAALIRHATMTHP